MGIIDRSVHVKTVPAVVSKPLGVSVQEGILEITPQLADRILKEANYLGQRRLDTQMVSVYAEMMRRNLWGLTDPISFARLGDSMTLVNGQHRLHAVVAFGRPVTFRIAVNDCANEEHLRALYYRFDTVMRQRTNEQIIGAIGLAEHHSVAKMTASATYRAVGVIVNGFRLPSAGTLSDESVVKLRVVDLRIEACEPWWEPARKLEACMSKGQPPIRSRIMKASVFAVALMTMKHQPAKAEHFWRGVAENDGLRRTDPRNAYVRDLLSRSLRVGDAHQGILAASIAWNAFYENRQLSLVKVPDNAVLRIAGTSINGKGAT